MATLITLTTVVSTAATAVYAIASIAAGQHLARKFRLPHVEKWILSWLVFDALIHFTLVTIFCFCYEKRILMFSSRISSPDSANLTPRTAITRLELQIPRLLYSISIY